jgi:hypothetical protein
MNPSSQVNICIKLVVFENLAVKLTVEIYEP